MVVRERHDIPGVNINDHTSDGPGRNPDMPGAHPAKRRAPPGSPMWVWEQGISTSRCEHSGDDDLDIIPGHGIRHRGVYFGSECLDVDPEGLVRPVDANPRDPGYAEERPFNGMLYVK